MSLGRRGFLGLIGSVCARVTALKTGSQITKAAMDKVPVYPKGGEIKLGIGDCVPGYFGVPQKPIITRGTHTMLYKLMRRQENS